MLSDTTLDTSTQPRPRLSRQTLLIVLALALLATLVALLLLIQNGRNAEALASQDIGACTVPVLDAVADPLNLNAGDGGPALNLRPDPASLLQPAPSLEGSAQCATASP